MRDRFGFTPLHHAVVLWQLSRTDVRDAAEALVAAGADVNARDDSGLTPLMVALFPLYDPSVRVLREWSAALGVASRYRIRSGMWRAMRHTAEPEITPDMGLIRWLCDHGADPNARDSDGSTVVLRAAWAGQLAPLRLLLAVGGDPNQPADSGCLPLQAAASSAGPTVLECLLANGADVNRTDSVGQTALHWAVQGRNVACVEVLLRAGADPNARADIGLTPLDFAVPLVAVRLPEEEGEEGKNDEPFPSPREPIRLSSEERQTIRLLVTHGADLSARNSRGQTFVELLKWAGLPEDDIRDLVPPRN